MTVCSSGGRARGAWGARFAAFLFFTVPLAATDVAHAQRHGPSQTQRESPAVEQQRNQPSSPQASRSRGSALAPVKAEFRAALEPYGRWQRHARWGEVWTPSNKSRDWRPYTAGRWIYADDWGWYWDSDETEARWGWVAYHYGRWVFDDELGWCWVAGDEWGPAWVQWRRAKQGLDYVGWAPLPPDDVIVEYVDEPRFWIFVRGPDFIASRIVPVILPVARYNVFINETVIVNRTVIVAGDGGRFAVNPGIAPAIVAAAARRPLRTYDVRPTVMAGTAPIANAKQVRPQDLGRRNFRPQAGLRPTQNVVRAADRMQPAQPLAAGERGRLGDRPPRAAQRGAAGQAPLDQPQQQRQRRQDQAQPSEQQPQQAQPRQQPEQGRQSPQQRAEPPQQGRAKQEPSQERVKPQRQAPTAQDRAPTEGRGRVEQRQPQAERRAAPPQRKQPTAQQPQRPQARPSAPAPHRQPVTQGRGGRPAQAAPQPPRAPAGRTEGRGGGGGRPPHAAAPPAPGGGKGGGHGGGGPGGGPGKQR
jgi:hypothetical protein